MKVQWQVSWSEADIREVRMSCYGRQCVGGRAIEDSRTVLKSRRRPD
jgi:hypothetical protein